MHKFFRRGDSRNKAENVIEKPDKKAHKHLYHESELQRYARNARDAKRGDTQKHLSAYVPKDVYEHKKSTIPSDLFDQSSLNADKGKLKKHGYADVNIVPKPTALVNIRESSTKKNKLKNFFKKIGFHKTKKAKKAKDKKPKNRNKRNYERLPRFNPFKTLKKIFGKTTSTYDTDYHMITSQVNSFKIIKYNKVPSIEEMQDEIPNIPEDVKNLDNKPKYAARAHPTKFSESTETISYTPETMFEEKTTTNSDPLTTVGNGLFNDDDSPSLSWEKLKENPTTDENLNISDVTWNDPSKKNLLDTNIPNVSWDATPEMDNVMDFEPNVIIKNSQMKTSSDLSSKFYLLKLITIK